MRRLLPALVSILLACGSAEVHHAEPQAEASEHLPGGDTTNTLLFGDNAFTMPASNITAEHESAFYTGNSFFNQNWVQAPASTESRDGLGPMFNARSCAACHFKDGRGSPPLEADEGFVGILLRLSVPGQGEHGEPLPVPGYGGQLQPYSILHVPAEATPRIDYSEIEGEYPDGERYTLLSPEYVIEAEAYGSLPDDLELSPRVAPAVFGLGLLEAIPLERLEELADPDDADGDGISGRTNRVWDAALEIETTGRFGWKAEQPSVRQQSAGAFLGDMGITSSLFPSQDCSDGQSECNDSLAGGSPEIADELLDKVALYARLLAVPARQRWQDADTLHGKELFNAAGCGSCHVARHRTGVNEELPELSEQLIYPYSDLLLHDLGEELSDERPSFDADGAEWRTPPLWGLGLTRDVNGHDRLLHDGRARGVAEAILWHGGEAEAAREAFRALAAGEREALVAFVESL